MHNELEMIPRISYIDLELTKRVMEWSEDGIKKTKQLLSNEPHRLEQTRWSLVAADLKRLAVFKYALGYPIETVVTSLKEHVETELRVLELRGTAAPFPVTVMTINHETHKIVDSEPLIRNSEKDFSLTNSRRALRTLYTALASGQYLIAHRIAQLIWDPPDASYIGPNSEVCTPDDQHLAYAMKDYFLGDAEKAREELDLVKGDRIDVALQVPLLRSLIHRRGDLFVKHLHEFLKWHEKEAKKKSNRTETDFFLSVPALGLSAIALRERLVQIADLPRGNPHFPLDLFDPTYDSIGIV